MFRLKFALLFVFVITFSFSNAQSWQDFYEQSQQFEGKELKKGIPLLEKAIKIAQAEKNDSAVVLCMLDMSVIYSEMRKFIQQDSVASQSVKLAEKIFSKTDSLLIESKLVLAQAKINMQNTSEAIKTYEEIAKIYKEEEGISELKYALLYNDIGTCYYKTGDYDLAGQYFEKALKIKSKKLGFDSPELLAEYNNVAVIFRIQSKFTEALEYAKISETIQLAQDKIDTNRLANLYNTIGVTYKDLLDLDQAEKYLLKSYKLYTAYYGEENAHNLTTLLNLVDYYYGISQYKKGLFYNKKATKIATDNYGDSSYQYAKAISYEVFYYNAVKEYEKSVEMQKKIEKIYLKYLGNKHTYYLFSLQNLAYSYYRHKDLLKADSCYSKVDSLYKLKPQSKYLEFDYNSNWSITKLQLGEFKKAEKLAKHAIDIHDKTYWGTDLRKMTVQIRLMNIYILSDQLDKADSVANFGFKFFTPFLKNVFYNFTPKEKKESYIGMTEYLEIYRSFIIKHFSKNPDKMKLLFNDFADMQSLLFNDELLLKKKVFYSKNKNIKEKYKAYQKQLKNYLEFSKLDLKQLKEKSIDLQTLEEQNEILLKEIQNEINFKPDTANIDYFKLISQKLKKNEVFVQVYRQNINSFNKHFDKKINHDIFLANNDTICYIIFVIEPNSQNIKSTVLYNGKLMEKNYYKLYKKQLKKNNASKIIYNAYWEPIQKLLGKNIKKIHFVSDGIYHNINLGTIKDNNKYLIQKYHFKNYSSTKNYLEHKPGNIELNNAIFFGYPNYSSELNQKVKKNDKEERKIEFSKQNVNRQCIQTLSENEFSQLEGTKDEVLSISNYLKQNALSTKTYLEQNASELNIKSIENPNILHIATHGFFYQLDDSYSNTLLNSGLLFSGCQEKIRKIAQNQSIEGEEDGVLFPYEIMQMNLQNTKMVVLSACETGIGEIVNGEGIYGLQRAFKFAGAESIVMSLWNVNDNSTKDLMIEMYKQILIHKDPESALRKAQLKMLKKYKTPYYWGAFRLVY